MRKLSNVIEGMPYVSTSLCTYAIYPHDALLYKKYFQSTWQRLYVTLFITYVYGTIGVLI